MLPAETFMAIISRPKAGVLRHVGVLLRNGEVAHCLPGHGEHISSAEEFAAGQDVTIVRVLPHSEHATTLLRITEATRAPKGYDATTNNCEMFVNRVTGRKPESPQLQGVMILVGLTAFLSWAARSS